MAKNVRKKGQDTFAISLASGNTIKVAAKAAGITERTAYRRAESPELQEEVNQLRDKMRSQAIGIAAVGMAEATVVLRMLMQKGKDSIKLGAARALLQVGDRMWNSEQLSLKLKELDRILNDGGKGENSQSDQGTAKSAGK